MENSFTKSLSLKKFGFSAPLEAAATQGRLKASKYNESQEIKDSGHQGSKFVEN